MNKKDEIRHHRREMAYWLSVIKDAQFRGDKNTENYAAERRREHREAVLELWASEAEKVGAYA